MVSFVDTGDWFKTSGVKPLEKFITPRGYASLLNIIFWSLFTLIPLLYLSFKILISGNLIHMALLVAPLYLRKYKYIVNGFLFFFFSNKLKYFIYSLCGLEQVNGRF